MSTIDSPLIPLNCKLGNREFLAESSRDHIAPTNFSSHHERQPTTGAPPSVEAEPGRERKTKKILSIMYVDGWSATSLGLANCQSIKSTSRATNREHSFGVIWLCASGHNWMRTRRANPLTWMLTAISTTLSTILHATWQCDIADNKIHLHAPRFLPRKSLSKPYTQSTEHREVTKSELMPHRANKDETEDEANRGGERR